MNGNSNTMMMAISVIVMLSSPLGVMASTIVATKLTIKIGTMRPIGANAATSNEKKNKRMNLHFLS